MEEYTCSHKCVYEEEQLRERARWGCGDCFEQDCQYPECMPPLVKRCNHEESKD